MSKESGIAAVRGSYGMTAVACDVDEDGWPDIFLACDTTPSLLFMNNHDGTFREEGLIRGIAVSQDGQLVRAWASAPATTTSTVISIL